MRGTCPTCRSLLLKMDIVKLRWAEGLIQHLQNIQSPAPATATATSISAEKTLDETLEESQLELVQLPALAFPDIGGSIPAMADIASSSGVSKRSGRHCSAKLCFPTYGPTVSAVRVYGSGISDANCGEWNEFFVDTGDTGILRHE